jgi:hypothetical protein
MPTDNDVLYVVTKWSGARPDKMSQNLGDWWDQTAANHSGIGAFNPNGIDDLILRCQTKFPSSPRLSEGDLQSGGNVQDVQDLVSALAPSAVASDMPMAAAPARNKKAAKKAAAKKKVIKKAAKKTIKSAKNQSGKRRG